jgi:quercetin dioxygenase-like cupin family protein
MPKLYFASPRDLPTKTPTPGMTQKIIRAEAATVAITDLAPKTVVESHKHPMEQTGVVTKGSLVMVIAGEQRILTQGDTYRVPANASHGARVFEEPCQVIDVWAPPRDDL